MVRKRTCDYFASSHDLLHGLPDSGLGDGESSHGSRGVDACEERSTVNQKSKHQTMILSTKEHKLYSGAGAAAGLVHCSDDLVRDGFSKEETFSPRREQSEGPMQVGLSRVAVAGQREMCVHRP